MKKKFIIGMYVLLFITISTKIAFGQQKFKNEYIEPGKEWKDIEGNPIQAHMGCVLYDNGIYYWYGMKWTGPTILSPTLPNQGCHWFVNEGISVYSSKDLHDWKFENTVLTVNYSPFSLLQPLNILVRPKVIKNEVTGKYILMAALLSPDFNYYNDVIYAISDTPTGPFEFKGKLLWSDSPNKLGMWNKTWPAAEEDSPERIRGWDMTLFEDTDKKAYLIVSRIIPLIYELSNDYQSVVKCEIMRGAEGGEAPAMFKFQSKYYLVLSKLSGWNPNSNFYCVSSSIDGPWENKGTFAKGPNENTTFDSQVNFVLPLNTGKFVFMADRFNLKSFNLSTYIWLPIEINTKNNAISVIWQKQWCLNKSIGSKY